MTGNYGNFPKYSAFVAFLLGLYWRKKKKRLIFPKIDKAGTGVITYFHQHFSLKKKNKTQQQFTISVYNAALLRIFCSKFSQYFESESWEDKPFY